MRLAARLSPAAEHVALAETAAGIAERAGLRAQARQRHDDAAATGDTRDRLPEGWSQLAGSDLLTVALDGDVLDIAVVAAALGRELAAGPALPTMVAARVVATHGAAAAQQAVAAGLRDGSFSAAVWHQGLLLGGASVSAVLLPTTEGWRLLPADRLDLTAAPGMDPSRPAARLSRPVGDLAEIGSRDGRLDGLADDDVDRLVTTLLAAEAGGVAAWCVSAAADYAVTREQFGQPIGRFQAVKHRCADLYCGLELALAAAWDAASALSGGADRSEDTELAIAVAAATAPQAAVDAATGLIQVLGGIGYTWEHDAHLYLKRALAIRQWTGGAAPWRRRACELALAGVRRGRQLEFGADAEPARAAARGFLASLEAAPTADRRRLMTDAGYVAPHWPRPYGLDAGPVEQLVIDEEFARAGVSRPDLVIGNWSVPTILAHGSEQQRERFVRPTLLGEITWCQMFSEPGAGSDLASLTTKAVRVDGGWALSGQKVWTSQARTADWAICLARTSTGERRHDGLTYFLVDMTSPGLDIRPLRELTGQAMFNEIFLSDVVVPDDCVVGEVGGGWRLARTTLANERVAMSSGAAFPSGVEDLLAVLGRGEDPGSDVLERAGELICRAQADAMLGVRATLAQVSGTDPGAASSVRKLVGMHLRQDTADLALQLLGPDAVALDDEVSAAAFHRMLASRALTIAGGTSEILHNVIGERILGLPR